MNPNDGKKNMIGHTCNGFLTTDLQGNSVCGLCGGAIPALTIIKRFVKESNE